MKGEATETADLSSQEFMDTGATVKEPEWD